MTAMFSRQQQKRDLTRELTVVRTALGLYDTDELATLGDYIKGFDDDDLELASLWLRDVARIAGDYEEGDGICRVCEAEGWSSYERYCGQEHEQQYLTRVDALVVGSNSTVTEVILQAIESTQDGQSLSAAEHLAAQDLRRDQLIGENRRLGGAVAEVGELVSSAIHNHSDEGREDIALHGQY